MTCKLIKGGNGLKDFKKKLGVKAPKVTAGFYQGALYDDGTPIAQVAFINEFGGDNIPPRPFMRRTLKENQKKWKKIVGEKIEDNFDIVASAKYVANIIKGDIQEMITELKTPPNAPSTIAKKKSSNPLIDTGTMRTAIQYKVEK